MHKDILSIDNFIANHSNFKKSKDEKRQTIADAFYMSFVRSRTDISYLSLFKEGKVIDLKLFETSKGNIYDYIHRNLRPLAKELFKKKGNGTPNASSGKAELLFHLCSNKIKNPVKGDIEVFDKKYEIKANGGKITNKKPGIDINKEVVKFCKDKNIPLIICRQGKTSGALNKPQFLPYDEKHKNYLGKNFTIVLGAWWKAYSGKSIPENINSWQDLIPHVISHLGKLIFDENYALMCIDAEGNYEIFKSTNELLKSKYNSIHAKWEYKCWQNNKFGLYMGI